MSSLITSLTAGFSAADALRLSQLQQQLQTQQLPPNSTITASYKFAVGSDGTLTPTEAKIVTKTANTRSEESNEPATRQPRQELQRTDLAATLFSLNSLARPRVQLSPSDELEVFSESTQQQSASRDEETLTQDSNTNAEADTSGAQVFSLNAKLQASTAHLYARNADLVYNVNPIFYEAA